MESPRLHRQDVGLKWAVTCFLLLTGIAFLIAGLMSREHYGFSHAKTVAYYLGDEAQGGMELPKLFSQLLQTVHVHSFTMPLVFFALWLGLHFTPIASGLKKFFIFGGSLSVLTYNAAPFLLRYYSENSVHLFTVGGIGLFFFYFVPAGFILYETWFGIQTSATR
ncbi:MAG: hypothetical protein K8R69_11505 [Deltaproteobacteria bacterium]|nr:hypothetical protein [Deltaproteobacteria bacterium]